MKSAEEFLKVLPSYAWLPDEALELIEARDAEHAAALAKAEERVRELEEALTIATRWMWDPDENSVRSFERINEWFMKETGHMRPGKSYSMETPPPDNLQQIWDEWRTQKSRDVLAQARAALEGK